MSTLVDLFEKTISKCYKICKSHEDYSLEENKKYYVFKSPSKHSTGFRFKNEDIKIFAGSPPKYITKMCDALFVVRHENRNFIIVVEIKSSRTDNYKIQLRNGCRFCEWVVQLFEDHGHYSAEVPKYLGLLVLSPNPSQIPKASTTAGDEFEEVKKSNNGPMSNVYRCNDLQEIRLWSLIKKSS